jgi:hypothetical protein
VTPLGRRVIRVTGAARHRGGMTTEQEHEADAGSGQITDTRIYQGDLAARPPERDHGDAPVAEALEPLIPTELREGETDDPNEAAEEGLAWIPPTDPPIRVGDDGDPEVAAGFGTSSTDEPFDADHHAAALSPHDEVETRVLEALRADAATTGLVDGLQVDVEGGRVIVAGTVDDLDDEDAVLAIAGEIPGVTEVVSRIQVGSI